MNIKNKLTLFTLVPFIITSLLLIVTFWLNLVSSAEEQIAATRKNLMELKKAELKNYMDLSLSGVQHILSDTTLSPDTAKSRLQQYIQSLSYDSNNYLFAYTVNGDRIALGSNLSGVGENFWNVQDSDGKYVVRGLIDAARNKNGYYLYHWPRSKGQVPLPKLSYTLWLPNYNWMVGTGFYIDDIDKAVALIEAQSTKALKSSLIICILVSAILSGLTVFNIRLVAKRIMRPLDEMNENLLDISTGQGDLTRRLKVNDKDEVGQLAASFNNFVQQIQCIVEQVLSSSFQVKTSAQHIDARNSEIHNLIKSQNSETDMVATAVNQMATSAIEIARSAEDAASSADGANGKSQQAIHDLHSSVDEVKNLAQGISDGASAIEALEQNVSDIISVLDVIRAIAEQTNLLALNAAIEAARAGEKGRGFAVVADEVRNLASRTQDSTGEIQQTIQRLKLSADSAVNIMKVSLDKSLHTVEKVELASSDISVITDEITNITDMITQIAVASKQQHHVSEDINIRMSHIADSSGKAEDLTDQSANDSHQLLALSQQLEKLVCQFKVNCSN